MVQRDRKGVDKSGSWQANFCGWSEFPETGDEGWKGVGEGRVSEISGGRGSFNVRAHCLVT
jgi:hypothetical protein